jgi:hypothetical protein
MKNFWIFLLTVGLLTLGASAQTGAGAGASAGGSASGSTGKSGANANAGANASANNAAAALSGGTNLQAELSKSLDARKAKVGDEVTATVTQDVKSDGKVVVRKGSKIVGHVTEASARTSANSESRLGIAFDRLVMKDGQEVALGAVVQALAPPANVAASAMSNENVGMGGSAPSGGARPNGGAGLGGVVGGTVGGVTNTVGSVAGSTTGAVGNTAGVAGGGVLSSTSHGVIGLQGLNLSSATSGSLQTSVISSTTQNVKLDSGTQMLLQVQR